jgi:hypothetical protein
MKLVLIAAAVLIAVAAAVVLVGIQLPDIKTVERVTTRSGVLWKETASNGDSINYVTLEEVPQRRLVRKIVGDDLPFGGTWTFELEPAGAVSAQPQSTVGCQLTIIEDGEVYNPVFRFVSRFIIGHTSTQDKYIAQLKRQLDET